MRLIDADEIVYESIDSYDTGRHESYYGTGIVAVRKEDIDGMPTIEECKEDKYKIGYADGYHKAESDYYARTATDRDDAFKMGIEVGRGERKTGRWTRIPHDGIYCTACGKGWSFMLGAPGDIENYHYCPNCGLPMIGGDGGEMG